MHILAPTVINLFYCKETLYLLFLSASWAASSARSAARFSRKPHRRASFHAALRVRATLASFISLVIFMVSTLLSEAPSFITTLPTNWVATAVSSAEASVFQPFLAALALRGNTTRLALYSRRRCSLSCLPSTDLLRPH